MIPEIVTTIDELRDIQRLTFNEYSRLGYVGPEAGPELSLCPELDLNEDGTLYPHTTIYFLRGGHDLLLGTVSITMDGPEGLHTDHVFPCETESFRQQVATKSQVLAGVWRIVIKHGCHTCVMGMLMEIVRSEMYKRSIDIALCTFNPHHRKFYERVGFIALTESIEDHMNAPSLLMIGRPKDLERLDVLKHRFFCD